MQSCNVDPQKAWKAIMQSRFVEGMDSMQILSRYGIQLCNIDQIRRRYVINVDSQKIWNQCRFVEGFKCNYAMDILVEGMECNYAMQIRRRQESQSCNVDSQKVLNAMQQVWNAMYTVWNAMFKVWNAIYKVWNAMQKGWNAIQKVCNAMQEVWNAMQKVWNGLQCIRYGMLKCY